MGNHTGACVGASDDVSEDMSAGSSLMLAWQLTVGGNNSKAAGDVGDERVERFLKEYDATRFSTVRFEKYLSNIDLVLAPRLRDFLSTIQAGRPVSKGGLDKQVTLATKQFREEASRFLTHSENVWRTLAPIVKKAVQRVEDLASNYSETVRTNTGEVVVATNKKEGKMLNNLVKCG